MCHEREKLLKLNLFQLMERHHSWGSVLISIYRIDAHDLKQKSACKKAMKKCFAFEFEFSLMTTSSPYLLTALGQLHKHKNDKNAFHLLLSLSQKSPDCTLRISSWLRVLFHMPKLSNPTWSQAPTSSSKLRRMPFAILLGVKGPLPLLLGLLILDLGTRFPLIYRRTL